MNVTFSSSIVYSAEVTISLTAHLGNGASVSVSDKFFPKGCSPSYRVEAEILELFEKTFEDFAAKLHIYGHQRCSEYIRKAVEECVFDSEYVCESISNISLLVHALNYRRVESSLIE